MFTGIDYVGFADESSHNFGRFRSICIISMPKQKVSPFNNFLEKILIDNNIEIGSFKWQKINGFNKCKVLVEVLDYIFNLLESDNLRIDVLIWDTLDSRHDIVQRDDMTNLSMMYNKLIKDVVSKRWEQDKEWIIFPDRNSAIDWKKLEEILVKQGLISHFESDLDCIISAEKKSTYINESTVKKIILYRLQIYLRVWEELLMKILKNIRSGKN